MIFCPVDNTNNLQFCFDCMTIVCLTSSSCRNRLNAYAEGSVGFRTRFQTVRLALSNFGPLGAACDASMQPQAIHHAGCTWPGGSPVHGMHTASHCTVWASGI